MGANSSTLFADIPAAGSMIDEEESFLCLGVDLVIGEAGGPIPFEADDDGAAAVAAKGSTARRGSPRGVCIHCSNNS